MTDNNEDEEAEDSRMFRDALLNGDERFNKFVKLTDSRFDSQARRTNKLRKELREEMSEVLDEIKQLRGDLKPALDIVGAWPYLVGIFTALGGGVVVILSLGLIP